MKKVRFYVLNFFEKCENLENRIFKLDNFIFDEDMVFYMGFLFFGVFMVIYNFLNLG